MLFLQFLNSYSDHYIVTLSIVPRDSDTCGIVHLSSDDIVTCMSGACQSAGRSCRKSVRGLLSIDEAAKLCLHLEAMRSNQEA